MAQLPYRRAAALGYRHAGCLQLGHVRTADPSADGRRSAASRTAISGGGAYRLAASPGRELVYFIVCRCVQGRLNQWAHWARGQGPRIFFFSRGPQLAVVK